MKFTIVENHCPIAYPSWRMVMRVKHFGKQLSWCNRGSQWSAGRGPMWQPCQGSLAHKFEVLFLSPRYHLISHTHNYNIWFKWSLVNDLFVQFHVVRSWEYKRYTKGGTNHQGFLRPLLRASFCSRLLYTCISSWCFAGEKTLKQLNRAWVSEMRELYDNGIEAGISMAPMFLKSMSRDPRHEPQRLTTVF